MRNKKIVTILTSIALSLGFATLANATEALVEKEKVVIQVSESNQEKWNLVLNNAKNIQKSFGKDEVDVEIVTFGPGIEMLKFDSAVGNRVAEAKKAGITIVACENTMKAKNLTPEDMISNTSFVQSGVVELIKRQRAGYAYLRP